ncbi:ABC transporter ATP-binding protein [Candidatus Fokinia crypta]|uniref:ABC transporter ATP-binding protein n=1 Tax=Candidatus Fokinia crypta TaxID=1920990 RepID=A0ABZ0UQX9_9RICK|nr:ABC transporter ATP-binding protein [Candidatus Fokinia cryptica]WPX97651.1 ABC transporter ATP-binding protein [Candidatus Fokinia cryptica]
MILLENIQKSVSAGIKEEQRSILRNISFSVPHGNVTAIVGPSGSGKSTLLQIIGLLDIPTNGKLILNGIECSFKSDKIATVMRKEMIGFVYQFHYLLSGFTVLENLLIPMRIKNKNADKEIAFSTLKKFNLEQKANMVVDQLSGGEKQRVAVARGIINSPKIVIADEPTGSLDRRNADCVFEVLLEVARENDTTVIIATHDDNIAKNCDQVFMLSDGYLTKM